MPGPEGSGDSLAEASDSLLVGRVGTLRGTGVRGACKRRLPRKPGPLETYLGEAEGPEGLLTRSIRPRG